MVVQLDRSLRTNKIDTEKGRLQEIQHSFRFYAQVILTLPTSSHIEAIADYGINYWRLGKCINRDGAKKLKVASLWQPVPKCTMKSPRRMFFALIANFNQPLEEKKIQT